MVDFDALMSPSGGSGFGERMYSGASGIMATGISLGMGKLLTGTGARRAMARSIVGKRQKGFVHPVNATIQTRMGRINRATQNRLHPRTVLDLARQDRTKFQEVMGIEGGKWKEVSRPDKLRIAQAELSTKLKGYKRQIQTNIRRLEGAGRTFSALGWGLAISWAADLGFDLMSPKISTSAARSNDQMFTRSSADGGAGYTQRQRALMAIHDSQSAIEGVIGNEAQFFHT